MFDDITKYDSSTSGKTLQFRVSGTVAGATVTLYADGNATGTATATSATTLVKTDGASKLTDGVRSFTARQTTTDGAESADSPALTVTIDTVAPALPEAPDLASASDSGASATDNITNIKTPTFTVGGTSYYRLTGNGYPLANSFLHSGSRTVDALNDGLHAIAAVAIDLAGNESPIGPATNVKIDTAVQPPRLPDLRSTDDTGVSDTDNVTRLPDARVDIDADEAGTVRVYVDGAERSLPIAAAGTASATLTGPPAWVSRNVSTNAIPVWKVDNAEWRRQNRPDQRRVRRQDHRQPGQRRRDVSNPGPARSRTARTRSTPPLKTWRATGRRDRAAVRAHRHEAAACRRAKR